MAEALWPPYLRISGARRGYISNSASSRSIFSGVAQTVSRSGRRLGFAINTANASDIPSDKERSKIHAFIASLDGQATRFWMTPPGYVRRGSFPATELLTNNTFANGTTGWSAASATQAVADRVNRITRSAGTVNPQIIQTPTVTQYSPYVLRSFFKAGRGGSSFYTYDNAIGNGSLATGGGISTASTTALSTSASISLYEATTVGIAGDYFEIPWASLARCFQIDNGQNLLTYSDQFDNAAWTKSGCTVTANASVAPDGTLTADDLVENSSTSAHNVERATGTAVSASAADYACSVAVKPYGRNFCVVGISEGSGSTSVYQYFNLSTGAVGVNGVTGGNWTNRRSFITPMGNGWYVCTVIGRKTNAATTLKVFVEAASADGTDSYLGAGTAAIGIWRATLAQSSVPTRLVQTTTTATTGTAQTGPNLFVKGLPASTSGLLLPSDYCQIGKQLNVVAASLDSDAAGLGYLQCAIPWRSSPADSAPVIVQEPMGHFMLTNSAVDFDDMPGNVSNFELTFEESCEP